MTATAENGWELSVTRFIDAPPAKVWDVMTNRINDWWCQKPWRAEFDKLERRAGGASTCTMYGPDGEVHPHPGTVLAWDEGKRFAFTDAVVGDADVHGVRRHARRDVHSRRSRMLRDVRHRFLHGAERTECDRRVEPGARDEIDLHGDAGDVRPRLEIMLERRPQSGGEASIAEIADLRR